MHSGTKKCFSETEVGAYIDEKLLSEEKAALEKRLFDCKTCGDEFISITGIIAQKDKTESGDVPDHLIEKAVAMFPEKQNVFDIVIGIVKDSLMLVSSANNFHIFSNYTSTYLSIWIFRTFGTGFSNFHKIFRPRYVIFSF